MIEQLTMNNYSNLYRSSIFHSQRNFDDFPIKE
jgi:hypothetical protein